MEKINGSVTSKTRLLHCLFRPAMMCVWGGTVCLFDQWQTGECLGIIFTILFVDDSGTEILHL